MIPRLRQSKLLKKSNPLFDELIVIDDPTPRPGSLNMAIDEVLLRSGRSAILRYYRWNKPAISFGYFVTFTEARAAAGDRVMVRRWTGGGIVPHGQDLTYSLIIPANDPAFAKTSQSIYENVHRDLCCALMTEREKGEFAPVAALYERRNETQSTGIDRRYNDCFASPVYADVMEDGRKIAGAAQRKTRGGLLHQGSIQRENLNEKFRSIFSKLLAKRIIINNIEIDTLSAAEELALAKYATEAWLRRR
jgi:lipoyl(octanoyl) transferase